MAGPAEASRRRRTLILPGTPIACARPLTNRPRAAWLVHGVSRKKTPARLVARARLALVEPSRASGGTALTGRDPRQRKRGPKPTIDKGIGKVSPQPPNAPLICDRVPLGAPFRSKETQIGVGLSRPLTPYASNAMARPMPPVAPSNLCGRNMKRAPRVGSLPRLVRFSVARMPRPRAAQCGE